jgi:Asp-tRNA(Asn)/Glu-tRNA(Gln) amidotransferase C subunit
MLTRLAASSVSHRFLELRTFSTKSTSATTETDDLGVPTQRTWSLNDFISSLPTQELSSNRLEHLHKLAALRPPEEGSKEWAEMKQALEEGVRLVEGVRSVDVSDLEDVLPERVMEIELDWGEGVGVKGKAAADDTRTSSDRVLDFQPRFLSLAKRTEGPYYTVERRVRNETDG